MAKYTVTENSPESINGEKVTIGGTIVLSKMEAAHPLRKGHIEPFVEPATEEAKTTSGKRN